jgi:hypothetical protein
MKNPRAASDLISFVAEFSNRMLKLASGSRVVLVGGSAFEFHFPDAYASSDADISVQLTYDWDQRNSMIRSVMTSMGYSQKSKCFSCPESWFTVEFVSGDLAIGELSVAHLVERNFASNGVPFLILSATAMMLDRLVAFAHWSDASSLLAARLAAQKHPLKIDFVFLKSALKAEGVFAKVFDQLPKGDCLRGFLE